MNRGLELLTALGTALLFACGGPVDVEEATYAGSCGNPVDVTDAVADSCDDGGCSCDKSCFAAGNTGSDDPAPGCAKDLQVTYSFGGGSSRTITCGPAQDENVSRSSLRTSGAPSSPT